MAESDYAEWQAAGSPYGPMGFKKWLDAGKKDPNQVRSDVTDPNGDIARTGAAASQFGQQGSLGYDMMTREMARDRDYLRAQQRGEHSVAAEQLRQGMQQQQAAQMSMAASAPAGSSSMAARNAMMNTGRAQSGMAGQAALAGIQERNAAAQQLVDLNTNQRGQDLQATLGSNQTAGNIYLGKSQIEADRYKTDMAAKAENDRAKLAVIQSTGQAFATSDERLKTDIKDGTKDADKLLKGLRAHMYKYKDESDGKGKQLGPMAQDLEKAGLKSAVVDTPRGKMVHGAKLALGLAAVMPGLDARLRKLEGKGK